ncbi:hypothetical protein YC2023_015417 [Brassica napus]
MDMYTFQGLVTIARDVSPTRLMKACTVRVRNVTAGDKQTNFIDTKVFSQTKLSHHIIVIHKGYLVYIIAQNNCYLTKPPQSTTIQGFIEHTSCPDSKMN